MNPENQQRLHQEFAEAAEAGSKEVAHPEIVAQGEKDLAGDLGVESLEPRVGITDQEREEMRRATLSQPIENTDHGIEV